MCMKQEVPSFFLTNTCARGRFMPQKPALGACSCESLGSQRLCAIEHVRYKDNKNKVSFLFSGKLEIVSVLERSKPWE